MNKILINDGIAIAISKLVDDSQSERRDPSHSEIEFVINKHGLQDLDPNKSGAAPVGKAKRIRQILVAGISKKFDATCSFAYSIIELLSANGGFRKDSPNYVGDQEISNLQSLLRTKGITLSTDGKISALVLDGLSLSDKSAALQAYVERAKQGDEDSALIVGTSKDLIEATAAHVITKLSGSYPTTANFPTLLGQAFIMLKLATSHDKIVPNEHPRKNIERNLFDLACSINKLRNKQGSGHGRPYLPDLTTIESHEVIRLTGIISEKLLNELNKISP